MQYAVPVQAVPVQTIPITQPVHINGQQPQQAVPIQQQKNKGKTVKKKTRKCFYPSDIVQKYRDDINGVRKIPDIPHSEKIQRCCIRKEWIENMYTIFSSVCLITMLLLQILKGQIGFAQGQPFPMFLEDVCTCKDEINGLCPSVQFTFNISSAVLSKSSSFYDPKNWDEKTGVCSQYDNQQVKPVETCRDTFPIGVMYVLPDNKESARLSLQDSACWAPDKTKKNDNNSIRFSSFEDESNIRNGGAFGFIFILGIIIFTVDFIDMYVPQSHSLTSLNLKKFIGEKISSCCRNKGENEQQQQQQQQQGRGKKTANTLKAYLGKLIFYIFVSLPFNYMVGFITTPGEPIGISVETQNKTSDTIIEWSEDSYKGGMLFYPSASQLSYTVILILALNATAVLPFCFIVCMPVACCFKCSTNAAEPGSKFTFQKATSDSLKCSAAITLGIFAFLYLGFLGFVLYELLDSIAISFDMDFSVFLFGCSLSFDVPDFSIPIIAFAFTLGLSRLSTMISQTLARFDAFIRLVSMVFYCSANKILPSSSSLQNDTEEEEGNDDDNVVNSFVEDKVKEKTLKKIRVSEEAKKAAANAANVAAQAARDVDLSLEKVKAIQAASNI
eukprot:g5123.t1